MLTRVEDYGDTMLVVGDNICATIDKTDGSIAVEEATENLVLSVNSSKLQSKGHYTGTEIYVSNIPSSFLQVPKKYTISFDAKIFGERMASSFNYGTANATTDNWDSRLSMDEVFEIKDYKNGWKRYSGICEYNAIVRCTGTLRMICESFETNINTKFRNFQFEEKAKPTSYVKGIRTIGKYNVPIKIPRKFLIVGREKAFSNGDVNNTLGKEFYNSFQFGVSGSTFFVSQRDVTRMVVWGWSKDIQVNEIVDYCIFIDQDTKKIVIYLNGIKELESTVNHNSFNDYLSLRKIGDYIGPAKVKFLLLEDSTNSNFTNPDGTPNEAYIQKVANSKGFLPNKGGKSSWIPEL